MKCSSHVPLHYIPVLIVFTCGAAIPYITKQKEKGLSKEMALINENYLKLPGSYPFSEIAHRVNQFKQANPDVDICTATQKS